jgi:hypothetical protein
MTDESAAFAAWIIGLLPRLALWPGGLALLLAGVGAWSARRQGAEAVALSALDRLALALGWVAVALLPLPGAAPLPLAPDALVLTGLLLAAEGLAGRGSGWGVGLCAGAVAIVAAGAGRLLFPFAALPAPVPILAAVAYAWGLAGQAAPLSPSVPALLRWLLWLGWTGLAVQLPAPGNLIAGVGVLVLLLAWAGWPQVAVMARRTAWIGGLALAGAVAALLLA